MSVLTGFTDFQKDCLKSHNDYRTAHNVEPLKLSSKLCSHSQEWAEVMKNKQIILSRIIIKKYFIEIYSILPQLVKWSTDPIQSMEKTSTTFIAQIQIEL